jgi:hypothetical protein
MKKSFKRITNESQLVGGKLYMRPIVNCHGRTWIDTFTVLGKPFTGDRDSERMVNIMPLHKFPKMQSKYVSDLLHVYKHSRKLSNSCGLYPFSNTLYDKISSMLDDRRSLMSFLGGKPVTDDEFDFEISDWEQMIYYDQSSDQSGLPADDKPAYYSDLSVIAAMNKYGKVI